MRRIVCMMMCIMFFTVSAFAEGTLTMLVDTDEGTVLITEDGSLLTQPGQYDVIYCLTYENCEPERLLYAVTSYANAEAEDSDNSDNSAGAVVVEEWPDEEGELPESGDAEVAVEDWEVDDSADGEADTEEVEIVEGEEADIDEWSESWGEEDWYDFEGDYFDSLYAVMNAKGELITDFNYVSFTHDVENAIIFATKADGFVDALDEQGNLLVSGEYAAMVSDGQGGYLATMPDLEKIDEYGDFPIVSRLVRITSDGTVEDTGYITGTYELGSYESGYACIPLYEEISETAEQSSEDTQEDTAEDEYFEGYEYFEYDVKGYIYLDVNGKNAFDKIFTYASIFTDGYAEVEDENYVARLMNVNGEYVTDKDYSGFDMGEVGAQTPIVANLMDGGFDLLSRQDASVIASFDTEQYGEELFASQAGDDFIMAYSDSCMMILNAAGEIIYSTTGDDDVYAYTWYTFCEGQPGRILISKGDWPNAQCSLMDLEGNIVGGTYKELSALSWKDGQGRYLVSDFEVVEIEYEGEVMYDADYETYRYGLIDQDGNTILETKYTMLNCIAPNRYWISDGTTYQFVDENGSVIYETQN